MIQETRQRISEIGLLLDLKAEEIAEKFDTEQLRAYFRSKDAIRLLIPSLYELGVALNENKILM